MAKYLRPPLYFASQPTNSISVGLTLAEEPGIELTFLEAMERYPRIKVVANGGHAVDTVGFDKIVTFEGDAADLRDLRLDLANPSKFFVPESETAMLIQQASSMGPISVLAKPRLDIVFNSFYEGVIGTHAGMALTQRVLKQMGSLTTFRFGLKNSENYSGLAELRVIAEARFPTFALAKAAHAGLELLEGPVGKVTVKRLWDEIDEIGRGSIAA